MTQPPREVLDYLAALTDGEFAAVVGAARDPRTHVRIQLDAIHDQLRERIATTDHNGRPTEGSK